jgi:hypothetical protein
MACILKVPDHKSKGVVVFTTAERDCFILEDKNISQKIFSIKNRWNVGLHHHFHDHKFNYNELFDFSMAGDGDLIEKNNKKFKTIGLDACNFTPSFFKFNSNEKLWDILYVARAVSFKKLPEFFKLIRDLYDKGKDLRVLLISPIPKDCNNKIKPSSSYCDIRKDYEKMFSIDERKKFTLLTTNFDDPFPFDLKTLSFFYKSSKIFVHMSDNERRCRVIAYAHASGMPVVCMKPAASLLPVNLQKQPYVYISKNYGDFPKKVLSALRYYNSKDYDKRSMLEPLKFISENYTKDLLRKEISKIFNLNDLDIRLGRSHGFGHNSNSIGWSIDSVLNYLKNQSNNNLLIDIKAKDVELYITKYKEYGVIRQKAINTITLPIIKNFITNYFPFTLRLKKFLSSK